MKTNQVAAIFHNLINYFPLFIFLLYARANGLMQSASSDWQNAFYIGGALALLVISIQLYNKVLINRLLLASHFFLIGNALLFLGNATRLLAWVGDYKGASFIVAFIVVGIITTFFSSAGFVGAEQGDAEEIRNQSLLLLLACVCVFAWSYVLNAESIWISTILPVLALRILNKKLLSIHD